tara:strand:- start:389 stop:679 length:291 start_codon:yes stop_codon:yes gene_type:complete
MINESNWGALAVAFYLSKYPELNKLDLEEVLPMVDTQGGLAFKYEDDLYFIVLNLNNEFEVSVITKLRDLAYIELPDAEDLLHFLTSLDNGFKIYL